MSWIRTKTEEEQAEEAVVGATPNFNRDMNSPPLPSREAARPSREPKSSGGNATLGQSIRIEGTLTGNEDLTINGTIKGKVRLNGHALTVGPNGKIEAELGAKSVTVEGEVSGNITADDRIRISASGTVTGDLKAPRIALDDGSNFAGRVDMGE